MAYCGPRGIPHSHFLGGVAEWTELDREKARWWDRHQREACPSCGTRADEWDRDKGGDPHAYTAELHHCIGCEERARAEKRITEQMGAGTTVVLTRRRE